MSKLEELLKEYCPSGVEYKKIGELCSITTGKLNANAMIENGKYPFFTCDAKPFKIDTYSFDTEAILISGNGSQVGHINYYNGKFNAYQRTYVLYDFQFVEVKFLLYCLENRLREYILLKAKKGSVPYITLPMLQEFEVPLPALPVQREIVRVLDSFTLYCAELTAELTARRKQYEFYRDKLLSFNQQNIETKKLSDIFNTRNGYTPSTSNKEYWMTNDIPWFRVEDIRTNGRILNDSLQHVSFSALKGQAFPANSIIISTSATIGEHALITCESIANQRFTYLILKDQYKDKYSIKYLFYYCFLLADFCRENLQQGNFASVDMNKFYKFEFPMPPLEVQERIVKVLDNFDAICSDLGIGLPAEIEKRKQQYEYYRDKLLTF